MGVEELPADSPQPRLCHLVKRPDFSGYGFNLHAEKAKPGQYIGTVDADSPAAFAGLCEGDRIVEVNGVNISQENHKQVVQRIKTMENETKLLVVDRHTEDVYKRFAIVVKGSLPTVKHISSSSDVNKVSQEAEDQFVIEQNATPPPLPTTPPPMDVDDSIETASIDKKSTTASESGSVSPLPRNLSPADDDVHDYSLSPTAAATTEVAAAASKASSRNGNWGGLNLNMTAKEMRQVIGSKKKPDPRRDERLDFHKKYEIIQTL